MFRKILSIIFILLVVLFGAITMTVPMITATAPAVLTVAFAAAAYIAWPKRRASRLSREL